MKSKYTLEEALNDFVEWGSAHYSPRTIELYGSLVKKFVRYMGNVNVSDIDITHISKYVGNLKKQNYAQSSVTHMIVSLRVFFKFLYHRRLIEWEYALIRIPKYVSKHFPTVRKEETMAMMKQITRSDLIGLRDKAIISFLYSTGLRVSELCDLTVEDIDTDLRRGTVVTKKSLKDRMILWDRLTNELLLKYLEVREEIARDEHIFVSSINGTRLSTRTIQRIVQKYRVGRRVVPHSFRSGLGTDLLENGANLRIIQKTLGHSSLRSLEPYTRVMDFALEKEYRRIRG